MFRFEIPRNVRSIPSFMGLSAKGWGWTLAGTLILASIVYLITANPILTIGSAVFVYFIVKSTFEIDEQTGIPKIDLIMSSYGSKKEKKLTIKWGEDLNEKPAVRSFIESDQESKVQK